MSTKQRLQELAGIQVNELGINKPYSKKDIINYFLENDVTTLEAISDYSRENYFLEYGDRYEDDDKDDMIKVQYIEAYYRYFKPKEIWCVAADDVISVRNYQLPKTYKYCTCWGNGDSFSLTILHNEIF